MFSRVSSGCFGCTPEHYMRQRAAVFKAHKKGVAEATPYETFGRLGKSYAIGGRTDEKRSTMNCVLRTGSRCETNSIGSMMS